MEKSVSETQNRIAIIVHGGAWAIPQALRERSLHGVRCAANVGYHKLREGGSAIDAVEMAVRSLEDNPCFDAGTGSALNTQGHVVCVYDLSV